jgi:hypothetical protein
LARELLRVNENNDWGGRLFPTITKLRTCGELVGEEGRDRERGDKDMDGKRIESSFTDHRNSPLDPMSTFPKIFNFDEGFILDPESTSNLTTGDKELRIEIWTTFSQLLKSPADIDGFPLKTILNTFPTTAEVELVVTRNTEGEAEEDEKINEGHESRYEG